MNRFLILALFFLFGHSPLSAQIEFLGSIDIMLGAGGKNSSFETNGINNSYRDPHINIHEFNLFMFAEISEEFFLSSRLQWDSWGAGKINPAKLTLAELSWEPQDADFSASFGRFVSPFGLYPKRQLGSENTFIHAPLAYSYFINISDERGYWPAVGSVSGTAYGAGDAGLTTLYFGAYLTGAQFNYIFIPEMLDISLAVSNVAPASQRNFANVAEFALVTRIGFQPVIYWQQGFSFSHGSFMYDAGVDSIYKKMEKFTQTLIGTDFVIAAGHFELAGEFIYSNWKVPAWENGTLMSRMDRYLVAYPLKNYTWYTDIKYEPGFMAGSYFALRYDSMVFEEFKNPKSDVPIGLPRKWDNDVSAISAAFGYKLSDAILFKVVYSDLLFSKKAFDGDYATLRALLNINI